MNRYPIYKPSGVKWLGEIPSHWEIVPLKHVVTYNDEVLLETENNNKHIKYVEIGDVDSVSGVKRYTEYAFKDAPSRARRITRKGDVIVSTVRTYLRAVAPIIDDDLIVSTGFAVLRAKTIEKRFLAYYLMSDYFVGEVIRRSVGTSYPAINANELVSISFVCPSLSEQSAIASYLDTATAKIDAAITQQQKMIDLLNERKQIIINKAVTRGLNPNVKMKDSGVEWIGEVPEGWKIKKLKHLAKIFGRIGFRGYNASDLVDEGEGAITLSPSNMKEHKMQYEKCTYLSWNKYYESPEIMIKNGDVLFVKTGSTYGKSCLVENLPMEATINPQLVVFKEFNCSNSFFDYLLQSNIIRDQVELSVIGGTIPTISQEKILNYLVPIPSLEEQLFIFDAINSSCKPLNEAIINANKQISLLQERKQIIINEVVTGKVKICK